MNLGKDFQRLPAFEAFSIGLPLPVSRALPPLYNFERDGQSSLEK